MSEDVGEDVGTVNCFAIGLPEGAQPNTLSNLFTHVASVLSDCPAIEINNVQGITFAVEIGADQDAGLFTFFYDIPEPESTDEI